MEVSACIVFHHERAYAVSALRSFRLMVETARETGLRVEAIAILDRPDSITQAIVKSEGVWLDRMEVVDNGDLGATRNNGIQIAKGEYIAFLDGDDLWGSSWLSEAYRQASTETPNNLSIWHPEYLYFFDATDWEVHSQTEKPHLGVRSFFQEHPQSTSKSFRPNVLFLSNVWSANVFCHRSLYINFPYLRVDRSRGFGIEDWSWNLQTLASGVNHSVVTGTVHLIRVKQSGSLGRANAAEGLLPKLPENAKPKKWRADAQ